MARKKKDPVVTSAEIDAAMDGVLCQQAFEHGSRKIDADFKNYTLVIPFPSFCLEWLFGINGCPLSRSWGLAAEPHVGKTAFIYEMINWHRALLGRGAVGCTEGDKDSQTLRNSITKYDKKAFEFRACNLVEIWQEYLMKASKRILDLFEAHPEYTVPICFAVDSYVGALCKSKTEAILKKGFAESSYATEAKLIGDWLRVFSNHRLAGNPFTLIGSTHTYANQSSQGMPGMPVKQVLSGGQKLAYMSAITIMMSNVGKLNNVDMKGQYVRFSLPKNTLAGTKNFRSIDCGLYWITHPDNTQTTWWDWDEATMWLLSDREKFPAGGEIGKELVKVCNIHAIAGGRFWSKELGVPQSDAMTGSELGKVLNSKPDVIQELRRVFNIYQHPYFQPHVKYQPVEAPTAVIPSAAVSAEEEADEAAQLAVVGESTLPAHLRGIKP